MIINLWMGFDDRAQSTAKTPDADGNAHPSTKGLGEITTPSLFRIDSPTGLRNYELWSLYFEVDDVDGAVEARNSILAMFPGQVRTIGGWWFDGSQVLDVDGTQTTIGDPVFPLHTRILEFIPDDVTYDQNGIELTRTRPLVPSDVNLGQGQSERTF